MRPSRPDAEGFLWSAFAADDRPGGEPLEAGQAGLAKLDWPVPGSSTLCRRQNDRTVTIPDRPGTGVLHLLVDSTGIKAVGEGEGSTRKHGAFRPRQRCKVYLGIDAETLEARAIEGEQASATGPSEPANGSRVGDGPLLPRLLDQIPVEEPIGMGSADGANDARGGHAAIAARTATAAIPTRRTGRSWTEATPGAQARDDILRANRRFGRAIRRTWSGCHRRSLIKAKMRCMKLLGERLRARPPHRQTAKLPIRAALLNRLTALGTPEPVRVA